MEDEVLEQCKNKNTTHNVYLSSGIRLRGKIIDFDDNVFLIRNETQEMMIYRHSTSTVKEEEV